MRITIDAGHNCYPDGGAVGILNENTLTKETVGLVKAKLENLGHQVFDVTPYGVNFNSVTGSLAYRVNKANSIGSDLHLCIHYNCGGGHGTECWISGTGGKSEQYARNILNAICETLGTTSRGIKVQNLYVPKYTKMPCVLIEGLFIDNQGDCNKYNANKIADAIVKGVTGQTSNVSAPVQPTQQLMISKSQVSKKSYTYAINGKVINDFFYTRNLDGTPNGGRIDIGDEICIIDCSFSKQMLLVEYPTPSGIKTAYIKYVPSCLQLYYENQYHNGGTSEIVFFDSSMNSKWGSLDPREQATPLFRKNGHLCVLYHSGDKIKNGFVYYDGEFTKF